VNGNGKDTSLLQFGKNYGAGVIRRLLSRRQANWSNTNWSTGLCIQSTGRKCQLVDRASSNANWSTVSTRRQE